MKITILMMSLLLSLVCNAQQKTDLFDVKFNEDIETLIKNVPDIHKGNLFDRTDMLSYGVSKNSFFYFKGFLPQHVELLSYKGQLAGYAFKMKTFEDQQKVQSYLKARYKLVPAEEKSVYVISTEYSDDHILIQLDAVSAESFKKGMNGYLNVKRPDFAAEFNRLMK